MENWLRVIASLLLIALAPAAAGQSTDGAQPAPSASSPRYNAEVAAPQKSAPLQWCFSSGITATTCAYGRWYTDAQVEKIAKDIWFLEDRLAKQNVEMERVKADASLADARAGLDVPKWVWITAGIVTGAAIGVGVGYLIWQHNDSDPAPAPTTTAPAAITVAAW